MRAIVIYYSETGNTEKVARAIASVLETRPRRIEDVSPSDLVDYDLIFLGTPVQGYSAARIVKKFIDDMPPLPGKRAAVFCTAHMQYGERTVAVLGKLLEEKGLSFQGGFFCKGWSRLVANFGPRIFNRGRPDAEDLHKAEAFTKGLLLEDSIKKR